MHKRIIPYACFPLLANLLILPVLLSCEPDWASDDWTASPTPRSQQEAGGSYPIYEKDRDNPQDSEPSGTVSNPHTVPVYSIDELTYTGVKRYATGIPVNQSAACYGDYLVIVTKSRAQIHLYNLKSQELLATLEMEAGSGYDSMGSDLYHSNQSSFGTEFYDRNDPFPLLYISQHARQDKRCFVEVFRLILQREADSRDYIALEAECVQTIYFPPMSKDNALGNVNCVIASDSTMVTYSRNNTKTDENYGICRISCFAVPPVGEPEVYLEDTDILYSYPIEAPATNMQGGCIWNGGLIIGQGYKNAGYIYLNIIDLEKRELIERHDLLADGISWEPEGCFVYNRTVMLTAGTSLWKCLFEVRKP